MEEQEQGNRTNRLTRLKAEYSRKCSPILDTIFFFT